MSALPVTDTYCGIPSGCDVDGFQHHSIVQPWLQCDVVWCDVKRLLPGQILMPSLAAHSYVIHATSWLEEDTSDLFLFKNGKWCIFILTPTEKATMQSTNLLIANS